jgi:N utilization substance protein A
MSKEMLLVIDQVANEKGVPKSTIIEALESALASAVKKRVGGEILTRVSINRGSGEFDSWRRWEVVADDAENVHPEQQLRLTDALKRRASIAIGQFVEEPIGISKDELGRIAAQSAKQTMFQKVRDAERAQVLDAFRHRVGELVTGTVKRVEKGSVFLDLGNNAEAIVKRDHIMRQDTFRTGDRVRGLLYEVKQEQKGPQLFVTRTRPEFMMELFKLEVPEVGQGLVTIMACARDPGDRAKIAVKANDNRTDPIGACIGMRGSRVQAVSGELNGERCDIVLWNDNPAQFVINAMAPAEVLSIIVDEDKHSMDVAVAEEKLSQAIGRGGQNVKLASRLTGWQLNVMTQQQVQAKTEAEAVATRQMFMDKLQVDEEIAGILAGAGFSSVDEIAYVPLGELQSVEEFDDQLIEELRNRARDALLTQLIAAEEQLEQTRPSEALADLNGMNPDTLDALRARGIDKLAPLADLDTEELIGIAPDLDEDRARHLILQARGRELMPLDGMDVRSFLALVKKGLITRDDVAELGADELTEIAGIDDNQAKRIIMAARAHWFA